MPKRRVGVIGAGPGGLALARILYMNGMDVSIRGNSFALDFRSGLMACEMYGAI